MALPSIDLEVWGLFEAVSTVSTVREVGLATAAVVEEVVLTSKAEVAMEEARILVAEIKI